jgi:hypothetical protein
MNLSLEKIQEVVKNEIKVEGSKITFKIREDEFVLDNGFLFIDGNSISYIWKNKVESIEELQDALYYWNIKKEWLNEEYLTKEQYNHLELN